MENNHPTSPAGQGLHEAEIAAKAALFGTGGAQGYLPATLSLMAGHPTATELEEASELLALATLAIRRWRRAVIDAGPRTSQTGRTTEQVAPEILRQLLDDMAQLTYEQPTTDEIERAIGFVLPAVQKLLRDWITSRNLIQAQAIQAAEFRARHPEVAIVLGNMTPRPGIHPVLHDLVRPFVQGGR